MSDANLRQLEMKWLKNVHWQPIETWSTGQGVPDVNGCSNGVEAWIENKWTKGWKVDTSPHQIAWIERRVRNGGRVFIAVRRLTVAGPRKGKAVDELYLFKGADVRLLAELGIGYCKADFSEARSLLSCEGGPAAWDWNAFHGIVFSPLCNPK